jgi:hypothetical protein
MAIRHTRSRKWMFVLFMVFFTACTSRGCRSCQPAESCDDCIKRCVDTQGVSPDICRGGACSSVCQEKR